MLVSTITNPATFISSDFAKTFLVSPTGTVLATNTELSVPGPFALWAGSVVATDSGELYQL